MEDAQTVQGHAAISARAGTKSILLTISHHTTPQGHTHRCPLSPHLSGHTIMAVTWVFFLRLHLPPLTQTP